MSFNAQTFVAFGVALLVPLLQPFCAPIPIFETVFFVTWCWSRVYAVNWLEGNPCAVYPDVMFTLTVWIVVVWAITTALSRRGNPKNIKEARDELGNALPVPTEYDNSIALLQAQDTDTKIANCTSQFRHANMVLDADVLLVLNNVVCSTAWWMLFLVWTFWVQAIAGTWAWANVLAYSMTFTQVLVLCTAVDGCDRYVSSMQRRLVFFDVYTDTFSIPYISRNYTYSLWVRGRGYSTHVMVIDASASVPDSERLLMSNTVNGMVAGVVDLRCGKEKQRAFFHS